jgi:hypothetical protein
LCYPQKTVLGRRKRNFPNGIFALDSITVECTGGALRKELMEWMDGKWGIDEINVGCLRKN